jgi:hypothetical protein
VFDIPPGTPPLDQPTITQCRLKYAERNFTLIAQMQYVGKSYHTTKNDNLLTL